MSGSVNLTSKSIDNEEDPLILMLKKTGCINLHYQVQVCISFVDNYLLHYIFLIF